MENKGCFYSILWILGIGGLVVGGVGFSVGRVVFGTASVLGGVLAFLVLRYSLKREGWFLTLWYWLTSFWTSKGSNNQPSQVEKTKEPNTRSQAQETTEELVETIGQVRSNKTSRTGNLDNMDGHEFEKFIAKLFEEMGYETRVTRQSNDQGVDVIAENPFETIAIQVKNHQNKVSNSAVQEVVAGKNMSGADKAVVVITSRFTSSAKELGSANQVRLVNRAELLDMIDEYM